MDAREGLTRGRRTPGRSLSSHGMRLGPQDALKKDSRGLSRVAAGIPRFPRLLPGTLGNFPGCLCALQCRRASQVVQMVKNLPAMWETWVQSSQAAAPVWGFTRATTGSSGSLSCGAREVRSPCAWRGGRPQRPAGSTHSSTRGLRPPEQLERPAVGEVTIRRGTDTPVRHPEKPAVSTHSSTRCVRHPELMNRSTPDLPVHHHLQIH